MSRCYHEVDGKGMTATPTRPKIPAESSVRSWGNGERDNESGPVRSRDTEGVDSQS